MVTLPIPGEPFKIVAIPLEEQIGAAKALLAVAAKSSTRPAARKPVEDMIRDLELVVAYFKVLLVEAAAYDQGMEEEFQRYRSSGDMAKNDPVAFEMAEVVAQIEEGGQ